MKTSRLSLLMLLLIPLAACQSGGFATIIPGSGANVVVQLGTWGGSGVGMDVAQGGAMLEFDCSHGTIDGPINLDATGGFAVDGVYFQEGGPIGMGTGVPARYQGDVVGQQMTLTVTNLDTMMKVGAFSLTFGSNANIVKCV